MIPSIKLIADSGSTKTEWCLIKNKAKTLFTTQGLSPYFVNEAQAEQILSNEVIPMLKRNKIDEIFFYGTGCKNPANIQMFKKVFKKVFPGAKATVDNDLSGAAKGLCGDEKGIACILGTGSNSCFYNGKKIVRNSPGLGFILGDEGSGAYLGKKVIQHYLYRIFDNELREKFDAAFQTSDNEILESVYKKPLPNRYLASFVAFLVKNRGHYMIENIIEDGLNDFFFTHVISYKESPKLPIHFTGGIAYGFREVVEQLCLNYDLQPGNFLRTPMEGLIKYHQKK
ncbi:N-acetylglucosamine kinase [Hanamia caeni]|jgi:N-acetylglucosamine kinase-like BadF-type ATPase|uniref:N-acetylglucosamine kinase n=1 Tax=Hanamia caeni TaxID=2294116 RepID=A0A3M9NFY6_9BACT|nr:BadF/BadG/BcrA/BcrD ATPase family protein [Hanamia caeni]RNI36699.1 N-acetylglucosamine kinase [Hanamia caeni]